MSKRTIITFAAVLITFVITTIIVSTIILNSDKILRSFSIVSVDNIATNYNVRFEKVRAAKHYDVALYDQFDERVYAQTVYRNNISLSLTMLQYDMVYTLVIYAVNEHGESKAVNNPHVFKFTEPSFSLENSLVLKDEEDYKLSILGDLTKKNYQIKIYEDDKVIKEERLTTNEYIINKDIYKGREVIINVTIYDQGTKINSIDLYNKISPVSDLKITAPKRGSVLDYKDVTLVYEGGTNATSYLLQIYRGTRLVREVEIRRNRVVISMEIFKKAEAYRIVVSANYRDYEEFTKKAEVTFRMNEKDTLKPAYIDFSRRHVRVGQEINVFNPNAEGNVYYTTNGDCPITNGTRYTVPITITQNMTLKTVVMEPLMNNSIVSEFDFTINRNRNISVYLSPSNQFRNSGVASTGYTNEMREMNRLTDFLEKRLKEAGVTVFRNRPYGNINRWTAESRYHGVDLHLAIHSNASIDHRSYGIETWIHEESSKTYSLAHLFQKALLGIYYIDPAQDPKADRGVKYANGAFGEVNEDFVPFGILLEIAHHDWETDAAWIMENKELIAKTIANTILRYFGIK